MNFEIFYLDLSLFESLMLVRIIAFDKIINLNAPYIYSVDYSEQILLKQRKSKRKKLVLSRLKSNERLLV